MAQSLSVATLLACCLAGMSACDQGEPEIDLNTSIIGAWRSPPGKNQLVDTEMGPARFEMSLLDDGSISVSIIVEGSPGGDGRLDDTGTYQLIDDTLISDVINDGKPVKIRIANDLLILSYSDDEEYRYARDD